MFFFIITEKKTPTRCQSEGRLARTSSDAASQTWILEPSDVKCTTKSEIFVGMKAFLLYYFFPPSAPFMHPSTITPFVSIHQLISYIHPSSHQNITTHIHQPTMSSINHSMVNMHQCIPTRVPGYV